jgi:hypothetical protein
MATSPQIQGGRGRAESGEYNYEMAQRDEEISTLEAEAPCSPEPPHPNQPQTRALPLGDAGASPRLLPVPPPRA